ncbi:hypothetical protein NECAME_18726 [Necator americanus]|uniref:Uncharacterized protein n=1 Tax=Necator americanus TaxID=51031 RepID=W2SSE0_NECAM|nr:hypothetical protein NECAME_18726 [Necator americanus]ETN72669.1 hypothetical protein NECAME_18726 [Necator americanus]
MSYLTESFTHSLHITIRYESDHPFHCRHKVKTSQEDDDGMTEAEKAIAASKKRQVEEQQFRRKGGEHVLEDSSDYLLLREMNLKLVQRFSSHLLA